MDLVRIHLLGPFRVELADGRACSFESETARAALAVLAVAPGRPWSRPALAALFWPDRPTEAALGNLRHTLSTLRRSLEDHDEDARVLLTTRGRVRLDPSRCWVDLAELEQLAGASDGDGPPPTAMAADLVRGELLEDVVVHAGAEWESWLRLAREHARIVSVHVLHRLVRSLEASGQTDAALERALQAVQLERWDEVGHRDVMRLLVACGDAGGACEHYEVLCRQLRAELGMGPAPETVALADAIRSGG
jgi:DNA-binding SARP family transcriptional activator